MSDADVRRRCASGSSSRPPRRRRACAVARVPRRPFVGFDATARSLPTRVSSCKSHPRLALVALSPDLWGAMAGREWHRRLDRRRRAETMASSVLGARTPVASAARSPIRSPLSPAVDRIARRNHRPPMARAALVSVIVIAGMRVGAARIGVVRARAEGARKPCESARARRRDVARALRNAV